MLRLWQVAALVVLGAALWWLVTLSIARHPERPLDFSGAVLRYATAPVGGLISILLCKLVGWLAPRQLLPGVVTVGAVAMMIDAVAIRWFPVVYGTSERALMLVGADLMWGYGVALAMTVLWTAWTEHRGRAQA